MPALVGPFLLGLIDRKGEIVIHDDKSPRISGDWLVTPTGKWNVHNTVHDVY